METTRRTLRVFTACSPENGCIRVARLVEHITTLHSWPAEDVARLAKCGPAEEWVDFLHFWGAMDAFWERREGRRKDDPSAALVREMRAFRDHLLAAETEGQVSVPELQAILRAQRAQSQDPSYWDEVRGQLPAGGLLDLAELAEALYVWLCEFEDEWNADVGSATKPGRTPSRVRLTPRCSPAPERTPLRDITNAKAAWGKRSNVAAEEACASTSTGGGDTRKSGVSGASRPSLAEELRAAERESPSPGAEVPTPRWRGVDAAAGPTPREPLETPRNGPSAPTPWRSRVERDVAALREEVEAKGSALAQLQEHCAGLCAMLARLPEPPDLSPRARLTWRRLQASARGDAAPEECVEELARELKTLEVQKVSSDEEIRRLLQKVADQGQELEELRRASLEAAVSACPSGVSIGAKGAKKEKDRRRRASLKEKPAKEKERRRRASAPELGVINGTDLCGVM